MPHRSKRPPPASYQQGPELPYTEEELVGLALPGFTGGPRTLKRLLARDNERAQRRMLETLPAEKIVSLRQVVEAMREEMGPKAQRSFDHFGDEVFAQTREAINSAAIPAYSEGGKMPYFWEKTDVRFEELLHGAEDVFFHAADIARAACDNDIRRTARDQGLRDFGDLYHPLLNALQKVPDHGDRLANGEIESFNGTGPNAERGEIILALAVHDFEPMSADSDHAHRPPDSSAQYVPE